MFIVFFLFWFHIFVVMSARGRTTRSRVAAKSKAPFAEADDRSDSSATLIPDSPPPKRTRDSPDSSAIAQLTRVMTQFVEKMPAQGAPKNWINGDCIAKFDPSVKKGLKATEWVRQVEELRQLNQWTDSATTHFALTKLEGPAKTWFQSLPQLNFTWAEWQQKIIEAFPTRLNYPAVLREMLNRKKGDEPIVTYYYDKLALLNRLKISGEDAVACIIDGLPDPIVRSGAEAGHYATPEGLLVHLTSLNERSSNSSKGPQQGSKPKFAGKGKKDPCYKCGKYGHIARDCKTNMSSTSKEDKPKKDTDAAQKRRCFYCNELGHISFHCPKKTTPAV